MRYKISEIIVCLILSITVIVVASIGIKINDRENDNIDATDETIEVSIVSAYLTSLSSSTNENTYTAISNDYINTQKNAEENKEETTTAEIKLYKDLDNNYETEEVSRTDLVFSERETDLLLRIGMCEAGGESVECIANVICTVLNRVEDDYFPNSIYEVLYQSGQFTPVSSGWINTVEPSEKCYEAIEMVESGWDESQGALYFEDCNGESWHSRNLEYLFTCDGMRFYK